MPGGLERHRFALVASLLASALLVALGALRFPTGELTGDEGTFVAMAASVARDGDLRFEEPDLAWTLARSERPPGLILQQTARGVTYSKPILYPLLAAPFYAVAGEAGVVGFHLLALAGATALAAAALARRAGGARALDTVLLFAFASVVVAHIGWKTTESLQVSLALAGLALTLGAELPGDGSFAAGRTRFAAPGTRLAGALLLGLLVALREPNAVVAAVPVAAALLGRRARRAAGLATASAASYFVVVALTVALTGAANPYKTLRSTFDAATGYPAGADGAPALARFDVMAHRATSDLGPVPALDPARSGYAALYFLVGRHSGLIAYFPAALVLLWAARRGSDRVGRAALGGFAAAALFYLVWWPENYFGGETHLGNRYLLAAAPCLVFAPRRLPTRRQLAVGWALALAFGASALVSVARTRAADPTSQSHTHAGLFRLLPYESTASAIDGRRDRYWASDFLRFVDPFARADATSFELAAGAPAAEVEIATLWRGSPLGLLVVADSADARLEISDWAGREIHALTPDGGGRAGGIVRAAPAAAWRVHRFWWSGERACRARFVRFRLLAPAGTTARVRYLGRTKVPETGFASELLAPVALPTSLHPGDSFEVPLALANRSGFAWSSTASLPVLVGARWEPLDGQAAPTEARAPFVALVERDSSVTTQVALVAPAAPGRYRLTLDLVLEDVAWFAERTGAPLAQATVTVSR